MTYLTSIRVNILGRILRRLPWENNSHLARCERLLEKGDCHG
jgi:hypothetical protein